MATLLTIPLAHIVESPHNPRQHFDADKLADLAASLAQVGQLTPAVVRPHPTLPDHYELAAGHRRHRAATLAGLDGLLCVVREMDDTTLLEVLTIENLQRDDVHPLEEADGYHALLLQGGTDVHALADRLGKSVAYVRDRLALRSLIEEMRRLFFAGAFSVAHAVVIARCSAEAQAQMLEGRGIFETEYIRNEDGFMLTPEDDAESGDEDYDDDWAEAYSETGDAKDDAPEPDRVADILANRKVLTVRALKAWIREHIRLAPDAPELAIAYPDTAVAVALAPRVVEITTAWGQLKDGQPRPRGTWKPVHAGSCEHIVLGFHGIGPNQGRTQPICIATTECRTHWGEEIADAERRAARASQPHDDDSTDEDEGEYDWERRARERKEAAERLEPLLPYLLELAEAKVREAATHGDSPLVRELILGEFHIDDDEETAEDGTPVEEPFPLVGDADMILRAIAWRRIARNLDARYSYDREQDVADVAAALGMSAEDFVAAAEAARAANPKADASDDEDVQEDAA